jgi:8-oxo-dGTP diphosphatase
MRISGRIVVFKEGKLALIKRNRADQEYYVFPGGGAEQGELPQDAAAREAFEELGIRVRICELLTCLDYNGLQYYYFAELVDGVLGSGTGEEYDPARDRGTYEPLWVDVSLLGNLPVRPIEVAELVRKYGLS